MAKVYIIGGTVGYELLNIATFQAVKEKVEAMGHEAIIPHELFFEEENKKCALTFEQSIKRRQDAIEECTIAVTIPGYADDRFAAIEYLTAKQFNLQVVSYIHLKTLCHEPA